MAPLLAIDIHCRPKKQHKGRDEYQKNCQASSKIWKALVSSLDFARSVLTHILVFSC
jgi:hypothetical protein